MTVYLLNQDQEKELYTEISVSPVGFSVSENLESHCYPWVYGSMADIADSLHQDLLVSDLAVYPESDKNFLLLYDDDAKERNISIRGVCPELGKNYRISGMYIYLYFGSATGRVRPTLREITEEAKHETYEIAGGEQAHFLYDLTVGKAEIFVRKEGAYYEWQLDGIESLDDLYEFADSIYWIKGPNS